MKEHLDYSITSHGSSEELKSFSKRIFSTPDIDGLEKEIDILWRIISERANEKKLDEVISSVKKIELLMKQIDNLKISS